MKINQLKIGAMLSYISMGLGFIISIAYTPIMIRLLGQSEFGLYNLVASVVSYLGLLSFGFGSAYMRYYSRYKAVKDKENIAKLNGMFLIIFSIIGLIAIIAGVILVLNTKLIFGSKLTSIELLIAKKLLSILVINIAISFPGIVFNSYITANEKFVFQKFVEVIRIVINPFIVLPLLLLGYGSIGMVLITTILNLTIGIINAIYSIRILEMKFYFKQFDLILLMEMAIFSSYIFINLIVDQINWNMDKFILGRFHGTVSVAIYGLAAQLNSYYLTLSTAISSVFIPRIHQLVAVNDSNKSLTNLFTRIGRIQFLILSLISTGLIFFGKPFIIMWAGQDYSKVYPIALLLIIPVTVPLIQNIGIEIQRAKNMHQFRSWVYLFMALANLLISIPLAKMYGGVGAAIGTALSLIVGNIFIMNWHYHVKIGLDMIYFWKQILRFIPALIIPILYGIGINYRVDLNNLLYFVFAGLIYIIIFCFSMWYFGMNHYEKDLISKPLGKIAKKTLNK